MKKQILGILLCLCMVLALFPVTAFAEGETPQPVTEIAIEVDAPILGESPNYSWSTASNPTGVINTDIGWFRISKDAYTGSETDVWEYNGDYIFDEDHFYTVAFQVQIYSRFDGSYIIANDVSATINNKNCKIEVAADGKSCVMSYVFEAKPVQPVSNIAVTVDQPVLGNTPDFAPEFTVTPNGSVEFYGCDWFKISEDNYTGTNADSWEGMSEDDVFEAGYYYLVDLYFTPIDSYYHPISEGISTTVNGMPHYDIYGDAYEVYYAYACGVFDPLEGPITLNVPFTTTVKLGDNGVPGETVFNLQVVQAGAEYPNVTVSASVTTNGAGSYSGTMSFTGPEEQLWNMLSEGAFVQQVNAGAEGWSYDDTVWGLVMDEAVAFALSDDAASQYTMLIFPANFEETENGIWYSMVDGADPVERMSFTNTYTKAVTQPANPTNETKVNPQTGVEANSHTGAAGNVTLWFALFAVSAACVTGKCVYTKRAKSLQAK